MFAVIAGTRQRPEGRVAHLGLFTTARAARLAASKANLGGYFVTGGW